jgi:hypothetical protein
MAEHAFTFEQIRHQAQEDALAYLLAAVVYFKAFGLTRSEADAIWDIFEPIAASLGLWYTWSREQDEVTFRLSRTKAILTSIET